MLVARVRPESRKKISLAVRAETRTSDAVSASASIT